MMRMCALLANGCQHCLATGTATSARHHKHSHVHTYIRSAIHHCFIVTAIQLLPENVVGSQLGFWCYASADFRSKFMPTSNTREIEFVLGSIRVCVYLGHERHNTPSYAFLCLHWRNASTMTM